MDLLTALALLLLLGAGLLLAGRRWAPDGVLETFGAGFVPYRADGWPRGVQEEEPQAWSRQASSSSPSGALAGTAAPTTSPEPDLIDLEAADAPARALERITIRRVARIR